MAYALSKGALPEVVRHTCDNPACCNPSHLKAGTQLDNIRDRQRRGRQARGSRNGRAKLSEHDVCHIKVDLVLGELSLSEIAARYQVSVSVIRDIKRGKTWRHVPWPTGEAMVKLAA